MIPRKLRGFSLTELLIVLMVLSLLIAVVMPSMLRGLALARRASCSANLRHIGQAFITRQTSVGVGEVGPMSANGWARVLKPYLSNNPEASICPSDELPRMGLPNVKLKIWSAPWISGHEPWMTDVLNFHPPLWEEMDCPKPGPGLWKMNDEDYQVFRTNPEHTYAPSLLKKYTPGEDPNSYWFVFEEGRQAGSAGSEQDYNDFYLHVTELPSGQVKVTAEVIWLGARYALVMEDGSEIGDDDNLLGADLTGPFFLDGQRLSYGMSWRAGDLTRGQRKVVALDYEREVAHVGGNSGTVDDWAETVAPRHLSRINVLFADGGVLTMDPDEIDPGEPGSENDLRFWDPRGP